MDENKLKIDFLPAALTDIEETKKWYNEQKDSLGYEFIKELENSIKDIIQNPYGYQKTYNEIRQISTNRFPYLISFIITQTNIVVLSILHKKRNPKELENRYENL
jgi:plasmid stabilization system protein ParE